MQILFLVYSQTEHSHMHREHCCDSLISKANTDFLFKEEQIFRALN